MFFYIDEAGNSGANLFDKNQPVLSYGVLSSETNLDVRALAQHRAILAKVGSSALHASELKVAGLNEIAVDLIQLHRDFRLQFDYYFIEKRAFALVTFFNAVFDAGINDAVKWDWYWTPLRFLLIAALDEVMDESLLMRSWNLCMTPNPALPAKAQEIVDLLTEINQKLHGTKVDGRLREVIGDALKFGAKNPLKLDFGTHNRKALSPNAVGFQFVCHAFARRLKASRRKALGIYVDRQTEFNAAQKETFDFQGKIAEGLRGLTPAEREAYLAHPFLEGVQADQKALISHFPREKVTVCASDESIGIQVADVFLWILNKILRDDELPQPLASLGARLMSNGGIDGISVPAMIGRWNEFEAKLPKAEDVPPHLRSMTESQVQQHRERVKGLELGPDPASKP